MCGRYYVDDSTSKEIRKILEQLDAKVKDFPKLTGEIFPSMPAPVLAAPDRKIAPDIFKWGFPGFKGKSVIINARSETAFEKPMFRESLLSRRCIIPASGFYEWDSSKNKIFFSVKNSGILYMAGLYNNFKGENRFVILTTEANSSIADVHDRMPLVLTEDAMESWLLDSSGTDRILRSEPPVLARSFDYV